MVVDDQPITRWGIVHHLTAGGWRVVAELDDLSTLREVDDRLHPDVVLVEPAGEQRTRALAGLAAFVGERPAARVLAFTVDLHPASVEALLECGCLGVIPRTSTPEALLAAMRDVAAGERHLHPRVLAALLQRRQGVDAAGRVRTLSGRELDVLRLVADGRSNAHIAAELGLSDATVKTHVAHVLRKLQAVDRAQAVGRALRLGLIE